MKNTIKINSDYKKKILIIGTNGFLGNNILKFKNQKEFLNKQINFIASDLINTNISNDLPYFRMDITNSQDTIEKIKKISPDVIILTAAMTDVDRCEIDKKVATQVNTEGPRNVIKACEKTDSKLVFISTDFIFDGSKKNASYTEEDVPNPLSHYAMTKYKAELAIINSDIDYLICRAAVLYGWNKIKLNFITWVLSKLQQNEKISIVKSQINSPTFVKNLAEIILKLIEKDGKGIFHTAGDCILNRYEIAVKCARVFKYDENLINPLNEIEQIAIRPKNAGLNINKLKKFIGSELKIYNLDDGLVYMKEHRFI